MVNTSLTDSDADVSEGEQDLIGYRCPLRNGSVDPEVIEVPDSSDGVEDSQHPSSAKRAKRTFWSPEMDIALIRQVKKREPFKHAPRSCPLVDLYSIMRKASHADTVTR